MPLTGEEVHEKFDAGLRRFVAARVRDPDSAEDVVQDVYLNIQTRIGTIEDKEKVGAWVYRVARNAVYDFYRTRKPTQELDEISPNPGPHGRREMEAKLSESVRGMLDGLSPDHKTAFYLTEYEGMIQSDLAAELGISGSGARSRVQRQSTAQGALPRLLPLRTGPPGQSNQLLRQRTHPRPPSRDPVNAPLPQNTRFSFN